MDDAALRDRSTVLRSELKQWEKQFATEHGGRKATREEIKEDLAIAAKYKEYHKAQDALSGKRMSPKSRPKRKIPTDLRDTRSPKRQRSTNVTPRKHQSKFKEMGLDASPTSLPAETTPAMKRMFVGPTPQKDGLVLGLFDLLPTESTPTGADNPSKVDSKFPDGVLKHISANVHLSTPEKSSHAHPNTLLFEDNEVFATTQKQNRTPQSATKRYLLDSFMTPSKRRKRDTDDNAPSIRTPASANKHFATPSFLRRDNQAMTLVTVPEEDIQVEASPSNKRSKHSNWQPITKPRFGFSKGIGAGGRKSLSSMIAELRRQEDERLDEEMDVMREMEGFGGDEAAPTHARMQKNSLVEVEQAAITLGPDGTIEPSEDEAPVASATAKPGGRVWKKRGQKRQTRRVIMRPVARIKQSESTTTQKYPNEEFENEDNDAVPETQLEDGDGDNVSNESDQEFNHQESTVQHSGHANAVKDSNEKATDTGIIKKAVRKVSATAHANFRKLKIRSRNAGGRGGSRFGRRR